MTVARKPQRSANAHALGRVVTKLTLGVAKEATQKADRRADSAIVQRIEKLQIKVSGTAADQPGWTFDDIEFAHRFTTATGNTRDDLGRPQVYFGYELTTVKTDADDEEDEIGVAMAAIVKAWLFDGDGNIKGARLGVSAVAPGQSIDFTGFVHATFHGLGMIVSDPDDED